MDNDEKNKEINDEENHIENEVKNNMENEKENVEGNDEENVEEKEEKNEEGNETENEEEKDAENKEKNKNIKKAIIIKVTINEFQKYMLKLKNLNYINYISPYSYLDTIDIIYCVSNEKRIRLFGEEFYVRYRRNNACRIIYNGIEYRLMEFFDISKINIHNNNLRIKLKGINVMTDLSYMFRKVNNLLDVPNISRIDTSKVKNMKVMFEGCKKLVELKGINRWNVGNVVSMEGMFYQCFKLKYLSEIEEWNPINLKNCNLMFFDCGSLSNSEVSKIEKWKNVNPDIIKEAFNGHNYGKKTNVVFHSISQPKKTINGWKNEGIRKINLLIKKFK